MLTDKDLSVLTLLRNSKHDPESRVTVHDRYPIEVRQELPDPNPNPNPNTLTLTLTRPMTPGSRH